MPVLRLMEPGDVEPDIRQTMEMYQGWLGDSVYSQFMAHMPELFRKSTSLIWRV